MVRQIRTALIYLQGHSKGLLKNNWLSLRKVNKEKQMEGLTEKQEAVYQYIKVFIESNGWPPSVSEIAQHFILSPSAVRDYYLVALEKKGFIHVVSGKARAIRILK